MNRSYAEGYAELEHWHWWFRARRAVLTGILARNLGHARSGLRLASLGCGPPSDLAWLVPLAGAGGSVVGLDADPSGALRSRVPRTAIPAQCELVLGRLEQPPLRPASFDGVLLLDVLEHLCDDAAGFSQAVRLMKPGGLLLVTVPAGPSLWGNQDEVSHHFRRYTAGRLRALFTNAGLRAPWVSHFNSLLFPGVAAVRWGRRIFRRPGGTKSDFELSRPGLVNECLRAIMAAERHLLRLATLPIGVSLLGIARAE